MTYKRLCLTTCIALFSSSWASADNLWMKNGDRMTGKISVLDSNTILLETDYSDPISIKFDKVKTLETDEPLIVRRKNHPEARSDSIRAGKDGQIIINTEGKPTSIALSEIDRLMKPKPILQNMTWTGNVDLALSLERAETDTNNLNIAAQATFVSGQWRHTVDGHYEREDDDDITNTDKWDFSHSSDRFLTDQWFWKGRLSIKTDMIEDLRHQRQAGTGPGYQFWDDELGKLSITGLMNRAVYEFEDGGKDAFYSASARWDYNRYFVGKKVELFASGELGRPLNDVADYILESELGLRYRINNWASFNVKYEKDTVEGTSDNNDLDTSQYTLGFGVVW